MKNLKQTILAHAGDIINVEGTGYTVADALAMTAAAQLDAMRFDDRTSAILARHENIPGRYPDSTELEEAGADLVVLNNASVNGLDMDAFGRAVAAGLDVSVLTAAIDAGLDPEDATRLLVDYEAEELSGMLANFVEAEAETALYPDPADRALMRLEGATVETVTV